MSPWFPLVFWFLCLNQAKSWGTTRCWCLWNCTPLDASSWGSKQPWDGHCWIYTSPARLLLSILHETYFAALTLVSVVETRGFALWSLGLGGYLLTETLLWLVIYNGVGWWQWTLCGTVSITCSRVFPSGCYIVPWLALPTILLMISFCSPHWSMLPPFPTEQQFFT